MRILHITPWYPSSIDPLRALFIQRHVDSLEPWADQTVLHIDTESSDARNYADTRVSGRIVKSIFPGWRFKEKKCARVIKDFLKDRRDAHFTHVVFHIAYPALVHFDLFEDLLPSKKFVIEHWSIYKYNFHSSNRPHRLAGIFDRPVKWAAVSQTLLKDIQTFSGRTLDCKIIPNVVEEVFQCRTDIQRGQHFLMIGLWKAPKRPQLILEALAQLKARQQHVHLTIGGYGPLWNQMKEYVHSNDLGDVVSWIESPSSDRIAYELQRCSALLIPTDYETFSVITAEALMCGTPVIASPSGALCEWIDPNNGAFATEVVDWVDALSSWGKRSFDYMQIAQNAQLKFDKKMVGALLYNWLNE